MALVPLTLRLDETLKARAEQAAAAAGVSVADLVRDALAAYLEPVATLRQALVALEASERHRQRLEDRIQVIADFIADHSVAEP